MALPKNNFMVALGLSLVTGAGFGLSFTVLDNATSTWLAILVAVIALGVSPFLAGWLSPNPINFVLSPISVLGSISIAWAIVGPFLDTTFIWFVIMAGGTYGGMTSVAFFVGWIVGHLRQLRYY